MNISAPKKSHKQQTNILMWNYIEKYSLLCLWSTSLEQNETNEESQILDTNLVILVYMLHLQRTSSYVTLKKNSKCILHNEFKYKYCAPIKNTAYMIKYIFILPIANPSSVKAAPTLFFRDNFSLLEMDCSTKLIVCQKKEEMRISSL